MADTRVVVVKPGDVLIIGNIGVLTPEQVEEGMSGLAGLKDALGLAGVVLFEGDIDIAAVSGAHPEGAGEPFSVTERE